jgi:hypothetical protein
MEAKFKFWVLPKWLVLSFPALELCVSQVPMIDQNANALLGSEDAPVENCEMIQSFRFDNLPRQFVSLHSRKTSFPPSFTLHPYMLQKFIAKRG